MKRTIFWARWAWLSAIVLSAALMPQMARAIDGSQEVPGGGIIEFTGAAETNWVKNASGEYDLLISYTAENAATDESPATFTFPGTTKAQILAIGGGGGGGGSHSLGYNTNYGGGGGGGAGGFVETNDLFGAATYQVTVGLGGAGGPRSSSRKPADYTGAPGTNTTITCDGADWITAYGGGGGGGETAGMPGGSGGGGSMLYVSKTVGTVNAGGEPTDPAQGYAGGAGDVGMWGGGGGGAGAAGEDASKGATGGDGRQSDITLPAGTAQADWPWYAGGGGGGHTDKTIKTAAEGIAGGKGGGGAGGVGQGTNAFNPEPGDPQTGGGGGGCNASVGVTGADGGSGVVYVRITATMTGTFEKPTDPAPIDYDGNAHTSVVSTAFYEVSGDNVGTNAGTYVAVAKLNGDYSWPDDTKGDVTVTMVINKVKVTFGKPFIADWTYHDDVIPEPTCDTTPAEAKVKFEYSPVGEENWSTAKPTHAGEYRLRVGLVDKVNYEADQDYAYGDNFHVRKVQVTFSDLFQKDWMYGTPPDQTPKPRCTVDPAWVVIDYMYAEKVDTPDADWVYEKPTELGTWAIRAQAPNRKDYEFTPAVSTFRIVKGRGNTFEDYVEITVKPYGGTTPPELTNFPYRVTLSEEMPYGFLYARAGEDGEEMCFTDADDNVLPYYVGTWNTHGDSDLYVKLPLVASTEQTLRLYWKLRDGMTAPDHDPEGVWSDWTKEDAAKVAAPDHEFDLVVRNGFRVNRWKVKPALTKTVWSKGEAPAEILPGELMEGTYSTTILDAVTGAPVAWPPAVGGAYRAQFTLDNEDLEYEDLEHHVDFCIRTTSPIDDLSGDVHDLTLNGRVLIANDDNATDHKVTGQSYWRTNDQELAVWWTHTGEHSAVYTLPNLQKYPGSTHRLQYRGADGSTNLLWRLENVILGNTFRNAALETGKAFLPWSPTGLPISEDDEARAGERDEAGTMVMRNTSEAVIYSPCYTNGIGTVYFDAANAFTSQGKPEDRHLVVDFATNVWDEAGHALPPTDENCFGEDAFGQKVEFGRLTEACWHPCVLTPLRRDDNVAAFERLPDTTELVLDIGKGGTVSNFYRVCVNVNCRSEVRFRIRRATCDETTGVDAQANYIVIDNIIASYPRNDAYLRPYGKYDPDKTGKSVNGWEGAMSVPFPSITDHEIYGRATNYLWSCPATGADPKGFVMLARMHYRWRYLNQASNDWQFVDLSPLDGYRSSAPLKLPYDSGDVEFFYESFLNVPYYRYYDYSGAGIGLGGAPDLPPKYTEEVSVLTNSFRDVRKDYPVFYGCGDDWFFRFREGKSEWDEVDVVLDGAYQANVKMEVIGDHTWRGLVKIPTNVRGRVTFSLNGRYRREAWGTGVAEVDRWWYPSEDVGKLPFRGETVTDARVSHGFEADGASNYMEFQFNDEVGSYTIGHAEYQAFNAWHDARSEDGTFVGTYTEASGVNDADMVKTNTHMMTWTPYEAAKPAWQETFEMSKYTDPEYPKYTDTYFPTHKMPHQWSGANGRFVDAKLTKNTEDEKNKNSGIAWQMASRGIGSISYTQSDGPSGLDTVSFKAHLAQSIDFHDFSTWDGDGSSKLANYTFVFPALLSLKNGSDYAPGATMSVVGYYRERRGCYELRIERLGNDGLQFSVYKWSVDDNEMTSKCLGSHWFSSAVFQANVTDKKPKMYAMFISVDSSKRDQVTVIGGLSQFSATPNDDYSSMSDLNNRKYRAICCVDKTNPLTSGSVGGLMSNCTGLFLEPRHWTAYLPKENLQWDAVNTTIANERALYGNDFSVASSTPVSYLGTMVQDRAKLLPQNDEWGFTPGRTTMAEYWYSNSFTSYGLETPVVNQTVDVYLRPRDATGDWTLVKKMPVSGYGFPATPSVVTLHTNVNCQVMLKTGDKSADVTIGEVTQTAWNGEDIANLDGTTRDFVYTQAYVYEEVTRPNGSPVTNRYAKLQPTRADPGRALSIRSPLLNGLGMIRFAHRRDELRPGAEIWVQVATNVTSSSLSGTTGYNRMTNCVEVGQSSAKAAWITVRKFTYAELSKSDQLVYYLGWHYMPGESGQGVFRITVPPATVTAATPKALSDPEWASVTITDFYVEDEPAIDTRSWLGWNIRTVGDATDGEGRMFLPDLAGGGLSAGLNNSCTRDISGDPSEFDKINPCVQSPTFSRYETRIGQVRFRARLYDANGAPAKVSLYGVANGMSRDWGEPLAVITVDKPRFTTYSYQAPSGKNYAAIRLMVDGVTNNVPGVQRVLLDEVVVSEKSDTAVSFYYARPFRLGLENDAVVENILDREQQPLCGESWGVQTRLKFDLFGNEVDVDRGFKVTFRYFVGKEPWGYDKWSEEPAASPEAELRQVGARSDYIFRSTAFDRATVVTPQSNPDTVVQYAVIVYYYEKGNSEPYSCVIPVTETEGNGWTNPLWYVPIDHNKDEKGEWKDALSPYTIIDNISPGRAWINEVNYNDGTKAENGNVIPITNQFVEIAVPWGVDMTDWYVRMTDMNRRQQVMAILGRGGLPSSKKSAWKSGDYDFFVIQSPKTASAGGLRDPEHPERGIVADGTWTESTLPSTLNAGTLQYDEPYQFELVRPNGVVEHQFVIGGTNEWRRWGPAIEYDGTNLVAELDAIDLAAGVPVKRFYAGDDLSRTAPGSDVFASFGVSGAAHGEEGGWSPEQRFTPGRKNELQDELTDWYIHPSGESCWVYARVEGAHLSQRIGDDTSPDTFVIVCSGNSTNIEYTAENWYQLDRLLRIEGGVTNVIPVGKEGVFSYEVSNVTGVTHIVAIESLSKRLIDAGLDPADRYTPAIMRWLQAGMANGRAFADPTGPIRNATFRGLWSSATNVTMGIKQMYLYDIDPTEGGWWLRGGTLDLNPKVERTWYYADGRTEAMENVSLKVKLYLSNDVARAGVTRPETYAPPRLQGPAGERSDDPATYSNWTGATFKVEGRLNSGMPHESKDYFPFRWFVFGPDSFGAKGGPNEFVTDVEIVDPFSTASPGYGYGWSAYRGKSSPWYRWNITEELQTTSATMLNKDSTYEGKPPFVKP